MAHSRFHSATSLLAGVAIAVLGAAAGCGDDPSCGPGDAPDAGVVASGSAVTLTYGRMTARLGNDCPSADAPTGVISLTIESTQTDGTGLFTLCVGRPDLLTSKSQALGLNTPGVEVRVIDLSGTMAACSFTIDRTKTVTGTATSSGMCGNGGDAAGFALTINGNVSLTRTCGAAVDSITVALQGRVAVAQAGD